MTLKYIKNTAGLIKRGYIGFLHNHFERAEKVPVTAQKFTLGKSTLGSDILYYQIGDGQKSVLFIGGIHGNETGTVKLTQNLIHWLHRNQSQFTGITFYIIPCLNPDGYKQAQDNPDYLGGGRKGRFNAHNVDLNRNFPTLSFQQHSVWSTGKNYADAIEVFCGDSGGSEPEVSGLIKFIKSKQIKSYIAFHSAGADVMGNDSRKAQELAETFSQKSGYKKISLQEWESLKQTGTAKEWCDEQAITYLEVEGKYRWGMDWSAHIRGLEAVLRKL